MAVLNFILWPSIQNYKMQYHHNSKYCCFVLNISKIINLYLVQEHHKSKWGVLNLDFGNYLDTLKLVYCHEMTIMALLLWKLAKN